MNLWPSRATLAPAPIPENPTEEEEQAADSPTSDVADVGIVKDTGPIANPDGNPPFQAPNCPLPRRPPLSQPNIPPPAPVPPSQPPPPAPAGVQVTLSNPQSQQPSHQPTDSLSLAQLRRIVTEFPRGPIDPIAYDFVYTDHGPHEDEIDEWFVYQFWQWVRLNAAQGAFEWSWDHEFQAGKAWDDADAETRENFLHLALEGFKSPEPTARRGHMGKVMYLVLGRWGDTAGGTPLGSSSKKKKQTAVTASQLEAMKGGVTVLAQAGGVEITWECLRKAFEPFWNDDASQLQPGGLQESQDELLNLMTIMYMVIQEVLCDREGMEFVANKLRGLTPSLTDFMVLATSNLRWDDQGQMPQTQVLLLFWKSLLFTFGGMEDIIDTKKAVRETDNEDKSKEVITASPLDYHVFRQELTSKYPAYVPPQPKLPLAAEQTSYLPRLSNHPTRESGSNGILPAPTTNRNTGGASILHQPVHIATPAPSPPPSPAVGGKGGKKQNYQTNQNFPFMYPPLDASSNSAGGKGIPEALEMIIGRKWEGSDIPASILEAGELFYTRTRMTRATRQLWQEREQFLQFERGWDSEDDDDDVEDLDLDLLTLEERKLIGRPSREKKAKLPDEEVDFGPNPPSDEKIRQRLTALEDFYRNGLPHFQSLVIVFHKTILAIVAPLTPSPGKAQSPELIIYDQYPNGVSVLNRSQENGNGSNGNPQPEPHEQSADELDAMRTREIAGKAATGIVILLLKWLKVSHVLKFEYITQLLLDANFVPLILRFIAHQDVQYMVDTKSDRLENSFFQFCSIRARASEKSCAPEAGEASSEDEAMPPPIKRRRSPARPADDSAKNEELELGSSARPEVDELGYPVNPLPKEPITDFSWRNFFTLINFLRILQKMCKNKVHRNMLLVQYKSSNILRKALKVPQPELRLYTLKLFKNQVPYCGRKWRQSNMRVITAVYLHCRPELRDEWLAGSDVDAEVEEAVPLEQALRSLTHFFNSRRYPEKMSAKGKKGKKNVMAGPGGEWGFFVQELEKMDWAWGAEDEARKPEGQKKEDEKVVTKRKPVSSS
ncbi:hypothetical protein MKZ38_010579 [Zalerion maritima]|uniref:Uncharacterized protein n=1 Tax=Zalerion maritima TaxID=339359 RepID=A0AAD5RTT3_9PEZI|nr:hypothetical protein MKZ38_010579 [Zalerion maritima]